MRRRRESPVEAGSGRGRNGERLVDEDHGV
jgi:hypothetical protein